MARFEIACSAISAQALYRLKRMAFPLVLRTFLSLAVPTLMALTAIATHAEAEEPRVVRVLYLIPQDRAFRADYSAAVENAMASLRTWYQNQLSGKTFTLAHSRPETCILPQPAAYYARDSWNKIFADVQRCAPVTYASSSVTWVIYADVVHECNTPGRLGAGTTGLTIMGRQDLEGLIGAPYVVFDCGEVFSSPIGRYIGGAGHELGHAFRLPHPPGCDAGLPTCDWNALMWTGYAAYPNTYFRADEKAILAANPFLTTQASSIALHLPRVSRAYVALSWVSSGAPASGYAISASLSPGGAPIAVLATNNAGGLTVAAPDGTYYVTVRATIDGEMVISNEVKVVVGTRVPDPPTTPTAIATGRTVTLSWSGAGQPTAYRLEAGTAPGLSDVVVVDLVPIGSVTANAVPPGTYYVRVRAGNEAGWSTPSAEITVVVH
jgi:PKD domain